MYEILDRYWSRIAEHKGFPYIKTAWNRNLWALMFDIEEARTKAVMAYDGEEMEWYDALMIDLCAELEDRVREGEQDVQP